MVTTQSFDFAGRPVYADQTYDALGRPQQLNQPTLDRTRAAMAWRKAYDVLGRVTSQTTLDEGGNALTTTTTYRGLSTDIVNPKGQRRVEVRNILDRLVSVTDPLNGVTSFAYEPFGGLTRTVSPAGNVTEIVYDRLGHKRELRDPNLGITKYSPDQFGRPLVQETAQQRKRGDRTDIAYDMLDRVIGRYDRDQRGEWVYDTAAYGKGQLAEAYTGTVTAKDYRRVLGYDALGRPSRVSLYLKDGEYTDVTTYDAWGRKSSQTYRRGTAGVEKKFTLHYNDYGFLGSVRRGSLVLWNVLQQDPAGRVTSAVLGNGLTQTDVYSPTSTRLTGATLLAANGTRRLEEGYGYDKLGNVSYRNQQWNGHGFIETFDYDELNRLKSSAIGSDVKTINYHPDGRIRNKTGVGSGDYAYPTPGAGSVRPNAVTSIAGIGNFQYDDNGNLLSGAGRTISWTAFDMPMTIAKGGASGTFVYGPEHQRARQDRGDGTSVVYADRQETELGAGGSVTLKTYWPLGIGVEIDRPGKATELRWTHTDRLGSPIALSDEAGLVQEELAYDPWGKRRDPVSHATPDTLDGKIDNKGFTNHEMLDQLDLVHMNGRVYDPFVARFLSGDPIIQDPTNGQNYDRYSYVFNNPTNLTDPTGFSEACTGGGTGTLIPIRNRTDDDKVINRPGGEREILRGNGKGLTLEKLVARGEKVNSAGTGAPNGKLSSEKSANREPTYSRVGFSSVSGPANDGSSVQVITDTWKRDSRSYGTPDQIMGQWFAFNPIEQIARDIGASERQVFWLGVVGMIGDPKQIVAHGAKNTLEGIGYTRKQLQHSFKHAKDFGVSGNANNK